MSQGEIAMKVRWGRMIFAAVLLLLVAGALWLSQNASAVRWKWRSLVDGFSDFFSSNIMHICLYVALFVGIALFVLWLLSRVVGWFRR